MSWGILELFLHRAVAAAGAVGRAVADAGRGAGAAVAAQARRGADDRELHRPDGDRSRHRGVPVHDLSQPALVGDPGRPCHHSPDVCAVVARSVPDSPPAGGWPVCWHVLPRCPARPSAGRTKPGAAITMTVISRSSRVPV